MNDGNTFRRWYWMPVAAFVLGITSAILLIWINQLSERQQRNFARDDMVSEILLNAATGHLWLEEVITGTTLVDTGKVWAAFDRSVSLVDALLSGGVSPHGVAIEALQEPTLRAQAEDLRSSLVMFKKEAQGRFQDSGNSGIGTRKDARFNALFKEIMDKAAAFDLMLQEIQARNSADTKRLFWIVLSVWLSAVIAVGLMLSNHEMQRRRAEEALKEARDRLEERVRERTGELKAANEYLQQEIIERKQAGEALRKSEGEFQRLSQQFHTLLDAITDSLTLLSPDLRVLWWNKGALYSSVKNVPDPSGLHCYALLHKRTAPCEGCPALRSLSTGKEESFRMEFHRRQWELRAFPIRDEDGKVGSVLTVAGDVTERTSLQAEAMRSAHLASLGELAAGVAHEINNPINGIINYAQILADEAREADGEMDIPVRIIKEGNRIANIVRSLLSFARERKEGKAPVYVHDIIRECFALVDTQLRKDGIIVRSDIPQNLPPIVVHFQQIQQVFLNIINNAQYALNEKYPGTDKGKILDIRAEEVMVNGSPHVAITFHDRGAGMPDRIRNRVMDPFFTTKPKGVGTGLGLSISHGIIGDHGGNLTIKSVEGEYTKVQIVLPAGE